MNALHSNPNTMKHTFLTVLVTAVALAATGCGTQTPADCQLQSSANGPYLLKFTQAGAGTGCTATTGPDIFGDLWTFDPFDNGLIVAWPITSPLPTPPNPNAAVYGKGKFSAGFPAADQTCTVPSLTTINTGTVSYAVTELAFLNTALYLGTTFKANVAYTSGTCNRPYTVQAINPAHVCVTKEDCDPFSQPFASGINSAYDTDCNKDQWAQDQAAVLGADPGSGICFFVGPFPGLGGWKPVPK